MKQEFLLLVVALLCTATRLVDAFNAVPGPKSVDGIYDGRFGIEKNVQAVFNQGGVRGYVQFIQSARGEPVEINVNLEGLDQYPDAYPWRIHNYPVRFALLPDFPCTETGGVYAEGAGDLYARLGGIRNDMVQQTFIDNNITLCGENSIIGRSLRIDRGDNDFICANIQYHGARVDRLRAAFDFDHDDEIQGDVIITKVAGRDDATIEVDVVKRGAVDQPLVSSGHIWSIHRGSCAELEGLFGNNTRRDRHFGLDPFADCSRNNQRLCAIGDLTMKCGALEFDNTGRARQFCTDSQLGSIPCSYLFDKKNPKQITSLVIRGPDGGDGIIGCARIGPPVQPQVARCHFDTYQASGRFLFHQLSPLDKTWISAYITRKRADGARLVIRENPTPPDYNCDELGGVIRRPGSLGNPLFSNPIGGIITHDSGALGSLCGILDIEEGTTYVNTKVATKYVPLFGQCSVIGRSLVLETANGDRLACCTITREAGYSTSEIASLLGYANEEILPAGK